MKREPSERSKADRYWEAYAASVEPDPRAQARVLARLQRRLGERGAEPPAKVQRAAAWLLVVKSSTISVALATGLLMGAKLIASRRTPPPPEPTISVPAKATPSPARASHSVVAPPPRAEPRPSEPAPSAPLDEAGPTKVSPPNKRPPTDSLKAEIDLLDAARVALRGDDLDRAEALLLDHAARFPAGALREEREAWSSLVDCRRGRSGAQAAATRFVTEHPQSTHVRAVRAACGLDLSSTDREHSSQE